MRRFPSASTSGEPSPTSSSTIRATAAPSSGRRARRPTIRRAARSKARGACWRRRAPRPQQIGRVVHATTLFTNALIERKGAKTGLLTTAGFARRAGDRPRAQVRALRSLHRDAQAAGAAAVAARGQGAAGARRQRRDRARCRCGAGRGGRPGGAGRREPRHLLPACLRQSRARARDRRGGRRALPEPVDLAVVRHRAGDPRVPARQHDGGQRLCAAAGRDLSRAAGAGAARRGHSRRAVPDAVQRRAHPCERSQARAGAVAGKRPGRRRAGRRLVRPQRRPGARAGLRHGRHDRQAGAGRRRRAAGRLRLRGGAREALPARLRPADADRHGRADRDRRRRRLDRAQVASSARSMSGRRAAAPSRVRPATAAAAPTPPSPMPT